MKRATEIKIEKAFNIGIRVVAIVGGVVILCFGIRALSNSLENVPEGVVTGTPVPTRAVAATNTPTIEPTEKATVTPVPTLASDDVGRVNELVTPTPMSYRGPFIKASVVQNDLVSNVLYAPYGEKCSALGRTVEFSQSGFYELSLDLGVKECRPISFSDISVGDFSVADNCAAICIGYDGKHPLFLYSVDKNYADSEYNDTFGLYIGYALEDNDALFCGCAPVPIGTVYDSGYGEGDNETLDWWVSEYFSQYDFEHLNVIYGFGRAISCNDSETVKKLFYSQELQRENLTWLPEGPERFCKNFLLYADAELSAAFSLIPTSCYTYDEYGNKYYEYTCSVVSLDADSYMDVSGKWTVTVVDRETELKIMPHSQVETLTSLADIFGLCTVVGESEQGFKTDKSGNTIYESLDGTVISGFEADADYALASGGSNESVYDILEKTGWIIDRERNAYYEGEYFYVNDVRYYKNGGWYDIDTREKVRMEVDGCYDWWYYVSDDNVFFYYNKDSSYGSGYWKDLLYCVRPDGKMYYFMWDSEVKAYSWFLCGDEEYEIVREFGDYYINCKTNSKKYLYRLIPEGKDKEMFLVLGKRR